MKAKEDTTVVKRPEDVYETRYYGMFKQLPGNRAVDKTHVKQLIRHMADAGNLTNSFPIVINENGEVIDGQHRLEALKTLGWPVCYRKQLGLNITTVRQINAAQKNWSWKDYAASFAELGKKDYEWFLKLNEKYGYGYSVLTAYCGAKNDREGKSNSFRLGEFRVENKSRTEKLLAQFDSVTAASGHEGKPFAMAMLKVMEHPAYDHSRMLTKMKYQGSNMKHYSNITDYLRAIEEVYNWKVREGNEERLF
jgi:hypothetical protein